MHLFVSGEMQMFAHGTVARVAVHAEQNRQLPMFTSEPDLEIWKGVAQLHKIIVYSGAEWTS